MYTRSPGMPGPYVSPAPQRRSAAFMSPAAGTASAGDGRFAANPFQYNGRVAVALVPCILVLLGAGSVVVVATLVLGLMISYILDALQFKHGAFVAIWVTFFTTAAAIAFSGVGFGLHIPITLSLLILLSSMNLVFLSGVWVSLQFRWLQLEHPFVVLSLERILFACCPLVALAIVTWGVIAAVGATSAPYYLLPLQCGLYWVFSIPRESSFHATKKNPRFGGKEDSNATILGPLESFIHAVLLVFLPGSFHLAVQHRHFLDSANDLCDHLLLFCLPILFLLFASTRGALSWITTEKRALQQIRIVLGSISLAVVLVCLEVRVVFNSFAHYVHYPPPFNYLLVTIAVFGLGFGFAAHVVGVLRGFFGSAVVTVVLLGSAVAAALVAGMPVFMLPAPAIAAVYLAHYYTSGSSPSYFIFVLATALGAAWYLMDNFFELPVELGGMPLRALSQLLLAALILAMLVPGATLLPKAQRVVGAVAVVQAFLFARVEGTLYNGDGLPEGDGIYPAYLVVATSIAGFLAIRRLKEDGKIGSLAAWLSTCFYLAKLPVLLVASPGIVMASQLLVLAVSPAFFLYKEKGRLGSKMKPWQGLAHAILVVAAVIYGRYLIFDLITSLMGHRPTHSLLMGSVALVCVVGCLPIVALHFPNSLPARRAAGLGLAATLTFILLQPPLPPAWHAVWDAAHFPDEEPDDSTIYGERMEGPLWPAWLLLGTVWAAYGAFFSAIPIAKVEPVRLGYAAAIGASTGIYVCVRFFPHSSSSLIYPLVIAATCCSALFLVFTHHPTLWSAQVMPLLFAGQVALLPLTYMAVGVARHVKATVEDGEDPEVVNDFVDDTRKQAARNTLLSVNFVIFLLAALVVKFKLSTGLRERLGVGPTSAHSSSDSLSDSGAEDAPLNGGALPKSSPFAPRHRSIQTRRVSLVSAFSSKKSWMPVVGNLATVIAFLLSVALVSVFGVHESERAIFFICPILLLLNHDASILTSFTDRQRYFPLTLACSLYLVLGALQTITYEVAVGVYYWGWDWQNIGVDFLYVIKNSALVLMCVPMHGVFNRFMWDYVRQADYLLLILAPLCIPAIAVTDVNAVRAVGALGLVFAIAQYVVSRQIRIAGMKFI